MLHIVLDEQLNQTIRREAKKRGLSINAYVKMILRKHFNYFEK